MHARQSARYSLAHAVRCGACCCWSADCAVGHYATTEDQALQCVACHPGCRCDTAGVTINRLVARDGWWRPDNSSLEFFACLLPGQCTDGQCAPHRHGPLCALCE